MTSNIVKLPLAAGPAAAEPPTIAHRVAHGRETNCIADEAIVPAPSSLAQVALPGALSGQQAKKLEGLLFAGFRETGRWTYTDRDGAPILATIRYDKDGDDKQFRSLRYAGMSEDGRPTYDLTSVAAPRPFYNLAVLARRSDDAVLVVEGEKAADAAARRFPEYVATTWPNGCKAPHKADVRDLAGRRVVLWPDADEASRKGMLTIAMRLFAVGCTVAMVALPPSYPEGWDLADADPDGLSAEQIPSALLATAKVLDERDLASVVATRAAAQVPAGGDKAEMHRFFVAANFLGTTGKRSYAPGGGYGDWFDLMVAAKNTYGASAFAQFCSFSAEHGGTDTDEALRRKWDSIEQLPEGQKLTAATFFREALDAGWEDPTRTSDEKGNTKGDRADPASVVLQQAAEAGDLLWLNQDGKAFASLMAAEPGSAERLVHVRVGGKRHKGIVSRRYRAAHPAKVLSAEQEKRAMLLLEHEAREGGRLYESAIRTASHDGCIYVDLCNADGGVVCVSPLGWEVLRAAPPGVRFVRGTRGALPVPKHGGSLADFGRHFNLSDNDVLRVVAFILGTLAPLPSFPILLVEGGQGTGKSMIGDMVVALCDPPLHPKGARLTMPKGEQNLLVHASGVRVPYIDNLSDISEAESDALCRLSTGGGTSARQHYSDEEEVQISATRPVVVTAIGTPTSRGDFLDRCLRVTGKPIKQRATEEALHAAFTADLPCMFGFVLTALSCALRNKPAIAAKVAAGEIGLARMADFGQLAEGAAEALALEVGTFSASLLDEVSAMQAESAMGEPLGDALVRYFSATAERKVLEGAATEVLDKLRNMLPEASPALPAANKLRGALRRIEPGLRDLGIVAEVREPTMGVRNRKAHYRIAATDAFVRLGVGEQHF